MFDAADHEPFILTGDLVVNQNSGRLIFISK